MTTAKLANYHSIIKNGKEVGKIQILGYKFYIKML